MRIHVKEGARPASLAAQTLARIDKEDVVWVGRRKSPRIMQRAVGLVVAGRPGLRAWGYRDNGESVVILSVAEEFTGTGFQTTARSEHYKVREVDGGELEAYRVDPVD